MSARQRLSRYMSKRNSSPVLSPLVRSTEINSKRERVLKALQSSPIKEPQPWVDRTLLMKVVIRNFLRESASYNMVPKPPRTSVAVTHLKSKGRIAIPKQDPRGDKLDQSDDEQPPPKRARLELDQSPPPIKTVNLSMPTLQTLLQNFVEVSSNKQ